MVDTKIAETNSDTTATTTTAPATDTSKTLATLGTVASGVGSLAGAALGASWSGVIGIVVLVFGGIFGTKFLIDFLNKKVDTRDMNNAGEDASKTATDIKNQAAEIRTGLDGLMNADLPKKPNQDNTAK